MTDQEKLEFVKNLNVSVRDSEALRSVSTESVGAYLQQSGWTVFLEDRLCFIYEKPCDDEVGKFQCLVPKPICADYAARMADILQQLSHLESRSQISILLDLLETKHE